MLTSDKQEHAGAPELFSTSTSSPPLPADEAPPAPYQGGQPPGRSRNTDFLSTLRDDDFRQLDRIITALAGRLGIHPTEVAAYRYGLPPWTLQPEHYLQRGLETDDLVPTLREGWLPESACDWLALGDKPTRVTVDANGCESMVREPGAGDDPVFSVMLTDQIVGRNNSSWSSSAHAETIDEALEMARAGVCKRDSLYPRSTWYDPRDESADACRRCP